MFGPVRFSEHGRWRIEDWLDAGNDDGAFPAVDCSRKRIELHHLISVARVKNSLRIEAAYLDPKVKKAACDRFREGKFSDDEKEIRELTPHLQGMAMLGEDELIFLRVLIQFDPPSKKPKLTFTQNRVE